MELQDSKTKNSDVRESPTKTEELVPLQITESFEEFKMIYLNATGSITTTKSLCVFNFATLTSDITLNSTRTLSQSTISFLLQLLM